MDCCLYYPQQLYDDASDQISYLLFACYSSSQETLQLDYYWAKQADNGFSEQLELLEETTAPINLYGMPVYQKTPTEHIPNKIKICGISFFYKTKRLLIHTYIENTLSRKKTRQMQSIHRAI
jgi:hypothetical protein